MAKTKSALIIGASRGLGLAIVEELNKREWNVTASCRKGKPGELQKFAAGKSIKIETLDITVEEEITDLKNKLKGQSFDLLFVNAGVLNAGGMSETVGEISTDEFVRVMLTNSLAPMRILEKLTDLVRVGGTVGVMSSGQGSIADNESGGNDVYRASKAALNMMMRSFAVRQGKERALLLLAPGWIKTDMGGDGAKFTVAEVIPEIVDTIVGQEGQTGLHYVDRFNKSVRW